MTSQRLLRAFAFVPLLYGLVGGWAVAASYSAREYWSPVPGYAVGFGLGFIAAITIWQCWRGKAAAPLWLAISGIAAIAFLLFLDQLFPLVNAVTEPPTLFDRLWYPGMISLVAVLTLVLPALARASLRRSA